MIEYDGVSPVGSTVFNFSLDGREYKLDVKADLIITPGTFEACLMTQTAKLAFYAGLYRTADRMLQKATDEFEIWESTKRNDIRCSLIPPIDPGEPGVLRVPPKAVKVVKPTETALDDQVKSDIEYPFRKDALSEITYIRDMLSSIVGAFRDRTQMLMKIGAKVRDATETDTLAAGELSVRDKQFQEREYKKRNKYYDDKD